MNMKDILSYGFDLSYFTRGFDRNKYARSHKIRLKGKPYSRGQFCGARTKLPKPVKQIKHKLF